MGADTENPFRVVTNEAPNFKRLKYGSRMCKAQMRLPLQAYVRQSWAPRYFQTGENRQTCKLFGLRVQLPEISLEMDLRL
jgi:hypothetical protein